MDYWRLGGLWGHSRRGCFASVFITNAGHTSRVKSIGRITNSPSQLKAHSTASRRTHSRAAKVILINASAFDRRRSSNEARIRKIIIDFFDNAWRNTLEGFQEIIVGLQLTISGCFFGSERSGSKKQKKECEFHGCRVRRGTYSGHGVIVVAGVHHGDEKRGAEICVVLASLVASLHLRAMNARSLFTQRNSN